MLTQLHAYGLISRTKVSQTIIYETDYLENAVNLYSSLTQITIKFN